MLNKMSMLLAGVALAVTAGAANADSYNHDRHDARVNTAVAIDLGGIAIGYNDGYWDTGHHWHHWRNKDQMRNYRTHYSGNYHARNHTYYPDNGWHGR